MDRPALHHKQHQEERQPKTKSLVGTSSTLLPIGRIGSHGYFARTHAQKLAAKVSSTELPTADFVLRNDHRYVATYFLLHEKVSSLLQRTTLFCAAENRAAAKPTGELSIFGGRLRGRAAGWAPLNNFSHHTARVTSQQRQHTISSSLTNHLLIESETAPPAHLPAAAPWRCALCRHGHP